jgi:hypothetical protein
MPQQAARTLVGGDCVAVNGQDWTLRDVQVDLPSDCVTITDLDGRRLTLPGDHYVTTR